MAERLRFRYNDRRGPEDSDKVFRGRNMIFAVICLDPAVGASADAATVTAAPLAPLWHADGYFCQT